MVSSGSGRPRSLTTSPHVTRSPSRCAPGEQRSTAPGEVGAEDQRGGGAGGDQAEDELLGHHRGVRRTASRCLLRQRAPVQPLEQRHAERADDAHLRVVHVGVDQPRQQQPSRRSTTSAVGVRGAHVGERAARRRSPRRRPRSARRRQLRRTPPVNGSSGVSRTRARKIVTGRSARADGRRRTSATSSAATASAMTAGSLPTQAAVADRRGDPVDRLLGVALDAQALPEPGPLRRRADQADAAEVGAAQRGVAQREVLGVVVGQHQHVGAGGHAGRAPARAPARGARGRSASAVVEAAPAARRRAGRRGSRPGAARGRAGPGSAPARARRGRRRRPRPRARPAAARAAASPRRRSTARRARCGPCR